MSLALCLAPARAQGQTGTISGRVTDSAGHPIPASITIAGRTQGAYATSDGAYTINDVSSGNLRLIVHYIGFRTDTVPVTVTAGQVAIARITMREQPNTLNTVEVVSPRLGETKAAALDQQKNADNIINVMPADEIRSLPNYNVAEALARMPGVTSERDEGEGKYVEIRGTPPSFNNVMIDGANVPGTLATDQRTVKLDDVPADLVGSIEVMKTLTADQPAKAIGGTVNLVTKTPDGPPRGYAFANLGYQTLQSTVQGQANLTYGGRVGEDQKFGFLFSGTYDRTNRTISDVEPFWAAEAPNPTGGPNSFYSIPLGSGFTRQFPNNWSQRPYDYFRTRYGLGGDLDYRASSTSSFYLKGLWSAFFDEANRWETGFSGNSVDTLIGGVPTVQGGNVSYTVSNRGPIEHTWGMTGGGKHQLDNVTLTWQANWAGSIAQEHNHYDDKYAGPAGGASGINFTTNGSTNLIPKYQVDAATSAAIANTASYPFQELDTDNEFNSGQIVGAHIDALIHEVIGDKPAGTKFGFFIDNEHKGFVVHTGTYTPNNPGLTVGNFPSSYTFPNFYQAICAGCYQLAPFGSIQAVNNYIVANPSQFTFAPGGPSDTAGWFAGTEQVIAGYVMQTFDVSDLHVNLGLRIENTNVGYVGYTDTAGPNIYTAQHGTTRYTDFFPSLQLRYSTDENTNLRFAFTRGIARPQYYDLAPYFSSTGALPESYSSALSEGNPALKPQYAWNYDLLAEHFFPSVGILSGGVFYKQISQFIFNRLEHYTGPITQFQPTDTSYYWVNQPQNGPSAWEYGFELDYTQHMTFLSGAWKGLGFDVNWTYVQSRAKVPIPQYDSLNYTNGNGQLVYPYANTPYRYAPIQRQFPNLFNVSLLYDWTPISARLSGQYTSPSIYGYGIDGTSNVNSGDNYNYEHFQLDFGFSWAVMPNSSLSIQALNLTNAVFGFFNGTTRNAYNTQREYYGTTVSIGFRQGF
jgi:TonB-dependent receptor